LARPLEAIFGLDLHYEPDRIRNLRGLLLPAADSAMAIICSRERGLPPAPRSLPFLRLSAASSLIFFDTSLPSIFILLYILSTLSNLQYPI
ncbi:MAG: hypothetical protein EBS53_17505, partial [Bacteroidetes bacterium]|nr:hypothetical protein [Bacteroidota bacterium]